MFYSDIASTNREMSTYRFRKVKKLLASHRGMSTRSFEGYIKLALRNIPPTEPPCAPSNSLT